MVKRKDMKNIFYVLVAALCLVACGGNKKAVGEGTEVTLLGPTFCADSAMAFCNTQCEFGSRTMNSEAHEKCKEWIVGKFQQYGLDVEEQKADLKGWDNTTLKSTNIIARFNPEAERRILICAHWDCRPWADNDPDSTNWRTPVLAANDAASGVGIMIELARLLQKDTTIVFGIDFVCFDAEDYGLPQWAEADFEGSSEDTWALGAQYFAKNNTTKYQFGILLDMVGGMGAHFYYEGFSMQYASGIVDKVWRCANETGNSTYFIPQHGGKVTDDHKPLNEAGIPTIDIIAYYPDCQQSSFGPTWHTINDNMQNMDANVLGAVGQTLVQVIYSN